MDPISAIAGITSIIGIGMSIFGSSAASAAARQEAAAEQQIVAQEEKINKQKQQQMELQVSRQQMQTIRNSQLARSMSLTTAVGQGAQFGTAVPGARGQTQGQAGTETLATSQNLQIGQNIFGLDSQINQYRQQVASLQGNIATDQGLASLGGDITKIGNSNQYASLLGMIPGLKTS